MLPRTEDKSFKTPVVGPRIDLGTIRGAEPADETRFEPQMRD